MLKKETASMGWITIYITGKTDFREEVLRKLEGSNVKFMPGYTGTSSEMDTHDLYWLQEKVDLREFKEAIGAKLIWKYRLNFFASLEAFIQSQKSQKEEPDYSLQGNPFLLGVRGLEHH